MSIVDPAWQQEEQPDQPTADEVPLNEDWPIDDYIEQALSMPDPYDPEVEAAFWQEFNADDWDMPDSEDLTTDDFADDW